jgi:hypothetical protein
MTTSVEIFRLFFISQGNRIHLLQLEMFYYTRKRWHINMKHWQNYNLYRKNKVLRKNLCQHNYIPQIPHGLILGWMWVTVVTIHQLTTKVMLEPSYWTAFTSKTYKWANSWVSPPLQMGYLGLILLTMGSASYISLSLSSFMCINRCNKTSTS